MCDAYFSELIAVSQQSEWWTNVINFQSASQAVLLIDVGFQHYMVADHVC